MPSTVIHQVTPEAAERGNQLLAESAAAYDRAVLLGRAVEEFEKLKQAAWAECRSKREAAGKTLLGESKGYRGY